MNVQLKDKGAMIQVGHGYKGLSKRLQDGPVDVVIKGQLTAMEGDDGKAGNFTINVSAATVKAPPKKKAKPVGRPRKKAA